MMTRNMIMIIAGLFLFSATVSPVLAYDTGEVDISIKTDGSADIKGTYSLNWGEYIAFTLIGNKEAIADGMIEKLTGMDVDVNYITSSGASVTVPSFAKVTDNDGVLVYKTPRLPYNKAGIYLSEFLGDYPLLKSFSPNAESVVPDTTVITFPDGYSVTYSKHYPDGVVPPVTH